MDGAGNARSGTFERGEDRRDVSLRLAVFYAALFLVFGVQVPYLSVWLDGKGLTASEIAIVTSTPYFIRLLVTPGLALAADHVGNHRAMVVALSWCALVLALALSGAGGFWPIFFTAMPFIIAVMTIMPLTETIAVGAVISHGLDYGRIRLWGSVAFIVVGLLGGVLVDGLGSGIAIWLIVAGALATVAAAQFLPQPPQPAEPARRAHPKLAIDDARRLIANPVFLLFLLTIGSVHGSHGMFYTFGALNWRAEGVSTTWVGVLWAIALVSEILLFAYSGPVVRRIGAAGLLVIGAGAAVVRWGLMAFALPLWVLAPLQVLHAATYGAAHLGAIHFIARAAPAPTAGTAQALYATIAAGVMLGAATMLSGELYAKFGGHAYLAMSAMGGVGLAAGVALMRRWDGGLLWTQAP